MDTDQYQARFTVRWNEEFYPASRLIVRRIVEMGLSRLSLVAKLGYKNQSKGHRVLDDALRTGRIPDELATRLISVLEIPRDAMLAAISATFAQSASEALAAGRERELAYHQAFAPYLRAEVTYAVEPPNPSGHFMQQVRRVTVKPTVWAFSDERRDNIFGVAIRRHHRRWIERPSACSKIVGYTAVIRAGLYIDFGIPFDIKGRKSGSLAAVGRLDAPPIVDPSIRASEPSRCSRWNLDLWRP